MRSDGRLSHRSRSRVAATPDWRPVAFTGRWSQVIDFYVLIALMVICAAGGGSSFAEVSSLLYVRPLAVICLIVFALTPARIDWGTFGIPMLLLALFAALMLFQLVPLPPSVWTLLPGRAPYLEAAALAGIPQPWRPLSLTPDLTVNSLVALVVPGAVLLGFAKLRTDQRQASVMVIVVLCCASALIGIAQFAGGRDSPLYLYRRTYPGFPVGLLSNRNHHAALLSLLFPALRVWTQMPVEQRAWDRSRHWLALALGVFTVPVVLATGSRAGIVLMLLAITAAFILFPAPRETGRVKDSPLQRTLLRMALPATMIALILATYWLGRATSVERLISLSSNGDQRFRFAPTVLRIIHESFPVGTGFGSFDPVFRQYEPDAFLISSYFNHAHNELLELTIMAGLPGLLLLAALVAWWTIRSIASVRAEARDAAVRLARLGSCVIAFILLASLFDYPLRAPLMAAVFAVACAWLCERHLGPKPGCD